MISRAVRAIANRPYSSSDRIPATINTAAAVIIDEIAIPQNRLNPPFAEVLPKFNDLLKDIIKPLQFWFYMEFLVIRYFSIRIIFKKIFIRSRALFYLNDE